jgi:ADP-ribose pyrophosphatase YjhB (NUDIX family)
MIDSADKGIPKDKWVPPPLWRRVVKFIPLCCMDMVFQRDDGSVLYGYRLIDPYSLRWSLVGGRFLYGEGLIECARRIAGEYGMGFRDLYLVGVFPVKFDTRSDVSIAVAASGSFGTPVADGKEFSSLAWKRTPPRNLGENYRMMLLKWGEASKSQDFLNLNKVEAQSHVE